MRMSTQFEAALTSVPSFPRALSIKSPVNNVAKNGLAVSGKNTPGIPVPHDDLSSKIIQTTHLKAMLQKQWYRSDPLDRRRGDTTFSLQMRRHS